MAFSKVHVITDPIKWPTNTWGGRGTLAHIRDDQNLPEWFWSIFETALKTWKAPKVENFTQWWKDLGELDQRMRGYKLAGKGDMPNTILTPGEIPHKGNIKVALDTDEVLNAYPEWGKS